MEKRNGILLLFISFIFCLILFYIDEAKYSLAPLLRGQDIPVLFLYTFMISILPLALYYSTVGRFRKKSFFIALFGYLPIAGWITLALISQL
jgi:hypothetical protein